MISLRLLACFSIAATIALAADDKEKDKKPEEQGMQYRSIGPFRGGRSLTASGIAGDPTTYYFGATGGGIWKSTDGATTWKPVFDHEKSSSIGSLAVAPSDPNIIYAGTGEGCIRGDAATGDGVYKSVDAGKTWKNVGLQRFARHRQADYRSARSRYRFRRRPGSSLRPQSGARHLPHHRWRQDVDEGALRG